MSSPKRQYRHNPYDAAWDEEKSHGAATPVAALHAGNLAMTPLVRRESQQNASVVQQHTNTALSMSAAVEPHVAESDDYAVPSLPVGCSMVDQQQQQDPLWKYASYATVVPTHSVSFSACYQGLWMAQNETDCLTPFVVGQVPSDMAIETLAPLLQHALNYAEMGVRVVPGACRCMTQARAKCVTARPCNYTANQTEGTAVWQVELAHVVSVDHMHAIAQTLNAAIAYNCAQKTAHIAADAWTREGLAQCAANRKVQGQTAYGGGVRDPRDKRVFLLTVELPRTHERKLQCPRAQWLMQFRAALTQQH